MKYISQENYLPNDKIHILPALAQAVQHLIILLPATVLVSLLTGFPVSATLIGCGIANIIFLFITKRKMPLFMGASFAYIPSICSITGVDYGVVAANELIAAAEIGIIASGVIACILGVVVKYAGNNVIQKIFPPVVSGSVAVVIGVSLAGTAVSNVISYETAYENNLSFLIAIATLLIAIFLSVYCGKKFIGKISILIAITAGCLIALLCGFSGTSFFGDTSYFSSAGFFSLPQFVFPWEAAADKILPAVLCMIPVAVVTTPETIAHVYQADLYINKLSEERAADLPRIANEVGLALIGDGILDSVGAFLGCPGTTSYGENFSAMSLSRTYSVKIIFLAAVMLIFISFVNPVIMLIYSIPKAVIGGVSIFLFGMIICQGLGLIVNNKVNLFDSKNVAIISVILIIGIGGQYGFENAIINLFGMPMPAIALATICGIFLNLSFMLVEKARKK